MPSTESYIRFEPIYQTRVWGGRTLESYLHRNLPGDGKPYGESWDISAREEANCRVTGGEFDGKTLIELWEDEESRLNLFGPKAPDSPRFPLLCKVLDARDRLSIQVHPPAELSDELGGEPKSEVWYVAHAEPDAELYIGVEEGVTEASFRKALEEGTAESLVHTIRPKTGQHIYIPSGRLHAIGAGLLIYEIQQNSDTTYRVYDWGRMGMDGTPRDLHIEESLKCIDFSDIAPSMDSAEGNVICECQHFKLEKHEIESGETLEKNLDGRFAIIVVASGSLTAGEVEFQEGDFFMTPAGADTSKIVAGADTTFLLTTWPG
ncbi:type I phosphomannose isomerase catalytic subunit [Verrucomicrobiales bacterium BCK34]|nr:type I phosphomannose isomerase catalytic subunit [Verrucomicrobiales bacterium BCK34]